MIFVFQLGICIKLICIIHFVIEVHNLLPCCKKGLKYCKRIIIRKGGAQNTFMLQTDVPIRLTRIYISKKNVAF